VVKLNGHDVDSAGKLRNLVAAAGVGSRAKVEYYRDGRLQSASIPLGELPANIAAASGGGGSGLSVVPLNPASRSKFNIPARVNIGVAVESVQPQSAAAAAGLQAGDVILEVNRATIDSVGRFNQLYQGSRGRVLLLVHRRGSTMYVILSK
jgi:serine protease Do